jgi:hypothetical protein
VLLLESDEAEIGAHTRRGEAFLPARERARNEIGVDAEVCDRVRVDSDDEDTLNVWRGINCHAMRSLSRVEKSSLL